MTERKGRNNLDYWKARIVEGKSLTQFKQEQRAADEALRRTNPLGIMCAECFHLCVLSMDGKRWLCQRGHGNERIESREDGIGG